jgi:response regulator NasT
MNQSLRVAIADDEIFMQDFLREILEDLGHQVVAVAGTGRELVEQSRATQPDLIITDVKMPLLDGLDAAAEIYATAPLPIIVVSAYHDDQLIARAQHNHIASFLVKPIKQDDLGPAIAIAMERFREFQAMCREASDLRQALEDRKLIERAKGIVMRRMSLGESEAFQHIQKSANDKRCKVIDIARMILQVDEILSDQPNR